MFHHPSGDAIQEPVRIDSLGHRSHILPLSPPTANASRVVVHLELASNQNARHSCESAEYAPQTFGVGPAKGWIPAFAGMTAARIGLRFQSDMASVALLKKVKQQMAFHPERSEGSLHFFSAKYGDASLSMTAYAWHVSPICVTRH